MYEVFSGLLFPRMARTDVRSECSNLIHTGEDLHRYFQQCAPSHKLYFSML